MHTAVKVTHSDAVWPLLLLGIGVRARADVVLRRGLGKRAQLTRQGCPLVAVICSFVLVLITTAAAAAAAALAFGALRCFLLAAAAAAAAERGEQARQGTADSTTNGLAAWRNLFW